MKVDTMQVKRTQQRFAIPSEIPKMEVGATNFFDLLKNRSSDGDRFQRMGMKNSSQREYEKTTSSQKSSNRKQTPDSFAASKREEPFAQEKKQTAHSVSGALNQVANRHEIADQIERPQGQERYEFEETQEPSADQTQSPIEMIAAVVQSITDMVREMQGDSLQEYAGDEAMREVSALLLTTGQTMDAGGFEESDLEALKELESEFQALLEEWKMQESATGQPRAAEGAHRERLQILLEQLNVQSLNVHSSGSTPSSQKKLDVFMPEELTSEELQAQQPERQAVQEENVAAQGQPVNHERISSRVQANSSQEREPRLADLLTQGAGRELKSEWISLKNNTALNMTKATSTQEIYAQIKEGMSKVDVSASMQEIVIKLKPEELGKVELRLELYKDLVIAKFDVENQSVKEAIESNLKDLRSSLEQSGFSNMQFDVNVNSGEKDRQEQSGFYRARTQNEIELNAEIQEQKARRSLNAIVEETQFEYLA